MVAFPSGLAWVLAPTYSRFAETLRVAGTRLAATKRRWVWRPTSSFGNCEWPIERFEWPFQWVLVQAAIFHKPSIETRMQNRYSVSLETPVRLEFRNEPRSRQPQIQSLWRSPYRRNDTLEGSPAKVKLALALVQARLVRCSVFYPDGPETPKRSVNH